MKINKVAMTLAEMELDTLPVKHRAGEWISKYHVRQLLYKVFCKIVSEGDEEE